MWQIPGDAASPEIPGIPGLDFSFATFGFRLCHILVSSLLHLAFSTATFGFVFAAFLFHLCNPFKVYNFQLQAKIIQPRG